MPEIIGRRNVISNSFTSASDSGRALDQLSGNVKKTTLALDEIQAREKNTRTINDEHVKALAESIAALGLIEPLVVDNQGRLLAGAHRLAALQFLRDKQNENFLKAFPQQQIPVHLFDFSAQENPDLALRIELAENEKRRNYRREEIEQLAERLKSLGYVQTKGRPGKYQRALTPALATAIGVSLRYVKKVLNTSEGSDNIEKENSAIDEKTSQLKKLEKMLNQSLETFRDEINDPRLSHKMEELLNIIQETLNMPKNLENIE